MSRRGHVILSNLAVVAFFFAACANGTNEDFDILIENGTVVDGSGNPRFYADVGITGDSIVAVGDLASKTARKTIDATGLVVSPGFIDVHAHSERGFGEADSSANLNYLIQGVTTVVTGQDGGGTFRVAETKAKWETLGIETNAVHLVGFGAGRYSEGTHYVLVGGKIAIDDGEYNGALHGKLLTPHAEAPGESPR